MKLEKYKRIFLEGKQVGILYHFTSLKKFKSILKSNFIQGNRGYVSFTRNSKLGFGDVRLVFDGGKLSNKYKIFPISDKAAAEELELPPSEWRKISGEAEEGIKGKVDLYYGLLTVDFSNRISKEEINYYLKNLLIKLKQKVRINFGNIDYSYKK